MNQSAQWTGDSAPATTEVRHPERLSIRRFFLRYPIFFLAFGPPIFRPSAGIDITKGEFDIWSFFQAGLLLAVAVRAIVRLSAAGSILIPREIRAILKYAFFLAFLFLLSTLYSPSRLGTGAYSILYLLSLLCVVEFIVEAYKCPPDWIQCLFILRMIAVQLLILVLLTLIVNPASVMGLIPGVGIRLGGGAVAPTALIGSVIAIVSAYGFLYSLEPRIYAVSYFLIGMTGVAIVQSRGCYISLFLSFALLGAIWSGSAKHSAYKVILVFIAFILLSAITLSVFGSENLWNIFNRGESIQDIEGASGRIATWRFTIDYCLRHPQGMGYVDGFRVIFRQKFFDVNMEGLNTAHIGSAHNTFMDVLAGAGWLALATYLTMLAKVAWLGMRLLKKKIHFHLASDATARHGIRCALLLLFFCCTYGMGATEFSAPLRSGFYYLYIIVAILLGASARIILAERARRFTAKG